MHVFGARLDEVVEFGCIEVIVLSRGPVFSKLAILKPVKVGDFFLQGNTFPCAESHSKSY